MIELIQFPFSPFCIPMRRILEFSGVKFKIINVPPQERGLFPAAQEGVQSILWRTIDGEIEGATFRLNDIYYHENTAPSDHLQYLRFKERKFGRGCIDQWRAQKADWLKKLERGLVPFEQMLAHSEFLLGNRPLFVDFDLFGMLENFLYSGHYSLPKSQPHVRNWHRRMKTVRA